MKKADVVVLGAGAAGFMAAIEAGKREKKVLLIDHNDQPGKKILISGGGRCNFTNLHVRPEDYVSANPHFCRSALSRYQPHDFIALVKKHGIAFHEKKLGQLFCDRTSRDILGLLVKEASEAGVEFAFGQTVSHVTKPDVFHIQIAQETFTSPSLIIATGGLSIPKIGATGFGYDLARQFGHSVVPLRPALDGFVWKGQDSLNWRGLEGLSVPVTLEVEGKKEEESLLFTHKGLSGPVALQASLYWNPAREVRVDWFPGTDFFETLKQAKADRSKMLLSNVLKNFWPERLAGRIFGVSGLSDKQIGQVNEMGLKNLALFVKSFRFIPAETVGYSKAEVTRGGVNTDELSSKTMESKIVPGLYFIGEVVDVTGRLGGFNFQWAWASGWAAGQSVS